LRATDGDLGTFTRGLASLTGTLRSSDSDLRALVDNAAAAAQQLAPFLSANSASITSLVRDLATDAAVTNANTLQLRAIFELLPVVADDLGSVAAGGEVHGVLEINTTDTVCPYILGAAMPGPTERTSAVPLGNECRTSAPDLLQRGAASSPRYGG
jgi:phospholipid/cholesterol/gamma-HCH transport system substrate-binding protein